MKRYLWVAPGLIACALLAAGGAMNDGQPGANASVGLAVFGAAAIWAQAVRPHARNLLFLPAFVVWFFLPDWVAILPGAAVLGVALYEHEMANELAKVKAGVR